MKKLIALLLLIAFPALASQNATQLPTSSPYAGLTMLSNINSAFNTFQTNFSGATAPSSATAPTSFQWWVDTSTSILKFYDGSTWLPVAKYSGSEWVGINNGVIGTIPTSTGSANAYVVTYAPVPSAYITGQHYPFISNFQNTSAATANINSLGAKSLKKQGGVTLIAGDIVSGAVVDTVYDGTNLQMISQLGNSNSGTVTSIATNNGVTGGTITSSGTIGLATISDGNALANITGSTAAPSPSTISSILDHVFGSTQGDILYRAASNWFTLAPGTNGQPLLTGGSSANPSFGNLPVGAISATGTPSSSTYLRGDATWSSVPAAGFTSCTQVSGSGTASCAGGYTMTGGGCSISGGSPQIAQSYPSGSTTWTCIASGSGAGTAFAICCH